MRIEQLEYLAAVTAARLAAPRQRGDAHLPARAERGGDQAGAGAGHDPARPAPHRVPDQPAGTRPAQNMTEVLEAVDRLRQAAGDQAVRRRGAAHRHRQHRAARACSRPPCATCTPATAPAASRWSTPSRSRSTRAWPRDRSTWAWSTSCPATRCRSTLRRRPTHRGPAGRLPPRRPPAGRQGAGHRGRPPRRAVRRHAAGLRRCTAIAHRLFAGSLPGTTYATDGAEMGKAMVAEGLGHLGAARLLDRRRPARRGGRDHHASHPGRPDDGHAADAAPPGRARARAAARPAAGPGAPGPDLPVRDRAAGHRLRPGHRGSGGAGRGPDAGDADQPRRG